MGGIMGRFFNSLVLYRCDFDQHITVDIPDSHTISVSRCLGRGIRPPQQRLEKPFLWIEEKYSGVLKYAVTHRKTILTAALGLFMMGIGLATTLGTEFFPSEDQGRLRVQIELPADSSLEITESVVRDMVDVIQADKSVAYTYG
jgi:HAE1 family hydrophobic/amphiphilic exporter-1